MRGNLTWSQKTKLIKTLTELADAEMHIPYTISEISAKLAEPIGRELTDMSTRQYVKECGFTWKTAPRKIAHGSKTLRKDRVAYLASLVHGLAVAIGVESRDILGPLEKMASKSSTDDCVQAAGNGRQ